VDEATVLLRLLRRYSPSGAEGPAVAEFVRIARTLGYAARVDGAGNGIARRGHGSPRILYLGHIDTVAGRRPARRARGRVYGRGAVDAKGPLAAALVAGATFSGPGTFEVAAAVGEEADSPGARYLTHRPAPTAVIAGEPSRWDGITVGYKGDLRVAARFRGRRTHYSSPHPTIADVALRWVEAVRALPPMAPGPSPFRSVSVKVVGITTGGDDDEWAEVTIDVRLPPGRTTGELLRAFPAEPGRPHVRPLIRIEPIEVDRTNPVVRALEMAVRAEGGRPTLWRKSGTSDLNLVAPAWQVAGAAYGPGDPHLDHTSHEWVAERELARAARVLRAAISHLSQEFSTPSASAAHSP
jgi:[amino group carrier protein]-lysine/ornithine hydrolase